MADFNKLIRTITSTVDEFEKVIPSIQRQMLRELQGLVKLLELNRDSIRVSASNIRLLDRIKGQLQKIILSPEYVDAVKKYVAGYDTVIKLQNDYFSSVANKFSPPRLTRQLKNQAIESVVNNLTENGVGANVTDRIYELLRVSVTSGMSYASFSEGLESVVVDSSNTKGLLSKYTTQVATDALNQFSGQYTQLITSDLDYEWYRYSGTHVERTRQWCIACRERSWFHISELPKVLKGDFKEFIDMGGRFSKTTGLPLGMMPGTDLSTFMVYRGGYNCGHQWRPGSEDLVPQDIKDRVYASPEYKAWAKAAGKEPKEVETKVNSNADLVAKANKTELEKIEESNIVRYDDLLEYVDPALTIVHSEKQEYYHLTSKKEIVIGNSDRHERDYFQKTVMAHEIGHAIHFNKGIIKNGEISKDFQDLMKDLKKIVKGKETEIHTKLVIEYGKKENFNDLEHLSVVADILGSLTKGKYGWGHTKSYHRHHANSESEIFAHAVSLSKVDNKYADLTDETTKVIDKMKSYWEEKKKGWDQESSTNS